MTFATPKPPTPKDELFLPNPKAALQKVEEAVSENRAARFLIKKIHLDEAGDYLVYTVKSNRWFAFDKDERLGFAREFKEAWETANYPADEKICPITIYDDRGNVFGGTEPKDPTDVWVS